MSTDVCRDCAAPLDVEYLDDHKPVGNSDTYEARTPVHDSSSGVSLGEGGTPCVHLKALGENLGMRRLHGKLEFLNPTGSFKDRGSAVLTTMGRDLGVTEFVEDSSGNAGASLSAYAAAAGLKPHVFAPDSAASGKLDQIQVFGATLYRIEGPRQAATDAAEAFVAERGLVYMSHSLSPYFLEGMKAVSYELVEVLYDEIEHVVLPVGNGALLIGMVRGFQELVEAGVVGRMPKFHAVQSHAVRPLVAALTGEDWSHEDAVPTRLTTRRFRQLIETRDAGFGVSVGVAFAEGFVVTAPIVRPDVMK